jgi:hypothetical protein
MTENEAQWEKNHKFFASAYFLLYYDNMICIMSVDGRKIKAADVK